MSAGGPEGHSPLSIPWRQWLGLGIGVMHLSPLAFWRLSMAEWLLARDGLYGLKGGAVSVPVLAQELQHLMRAYPDIHSRKTSPHGDWK